MGSPPAVTEEPQDNARPPKHPMAHIFSAVLYASLEADAVVATRFPECRLNARHVEAAIAAQESTLHGPGIAQLGNNIFMILGMRCVDTPPQGAQLD